MRVERWVENAVLVLAVVGIAYVGISGSRALHLLQVQTDAARFSYERVQDANYVPGGSACQEVRLRPRNASEVERDRCAEAAEAHRIQLNSLIEYRRAAESAEISAANAYWQTFAGIFSIIGIVATSGLTILAVWFTRRSVDISSQTFENYMKFEGGHLVLSIRKVIDDAKGVKVVIEVTNLGRSTCLVHGIDWAWQTHTRYPRGGFPSGPPRHEVIAAATCLDLGFIRRERGEGSPYLVGVVRYSSPISDDHRAYFRFKIRPVPDERSWSAEPLLSKR